MNADEVELMRPLVVGLLQSIRTEDLKGIYKVYSRLESEHGVADGAHAAAMLLADEMRQEKARSRAMLARANEESSKFAQAYMDLKQKQAEWLEINRQQAERIRQLRERIEPGRVAA